MKSTYQILNEKLEREINSLQRRINKQLHLIEFAGGAAGGGGGGGIDPVYSPTEAGSAQNRGYIAGLSPGNSSAIIANPAVIDQFRREKEFGRFTYQDVPAKPPASDTLGLGMGMGLDQNALNATKAFIQQHHPEAAREIEQAADPNAIGYLSWKTVNQAVTNRNTKDIQGQLEKYGLFNPTTGRIPNALGDQYNVQDVNTAFAKKLKQMQDEIGGQRQKGSQVSNKILQTLNK